MSSRLAEIERGVELREPVAVGRRGQDDLSAPSLSSDPRRERCIITVAGIHQEVVAITQARRKEGLP